MLVLNDRRNGSSSGFARLTKTQFTKTLLPKTLITKTQLRLLPLLIASALSATAHAQTASDAPKNATGGLEEVMVTARREAESAQNVPITIAAISGENLTQRAITNVSEVQFLVPTLRVVNSQEEGQDTQFALRGMRSTGVVTYFAQVPADGGIVGRELYDLGSVQVLKGPQGTLFGKNTSAGAILFEPAIPKDETSGFLQFTAGNYNETGMQGMFNTALTDTLLVRIAAQTEKRDGFTKVVNQGAGSGTPAQGSVDSDSQRISLLFTPNESFENLLVADRFNADESPVPGRLLRSVPCPANPNIGQLLLQGSCAYPGWDAAVAEDMALNAHETINPFDARVTTRAWGLTDQATFNVAEGITIKNIFGYRKANKQRVFDGDSTPFDLFKSDADETDHAYTDELQLQWNVDAWKIIVGAFYGDTRTYFDDIFNIGVNSTYGAPLNPIARTFDQRDISKAIFSQATYAVTDKFNVTLGARYTDETRRYKDTDFTGGACSYGPDQADADLATCTYKNSVSFYEPSWTLSADYKLLDNTLVYATFRRGFNSGGINFSPPVPYGTEKINDIEVGVKSDFDVAGAPTRVNVSVFRSSYSNIQRQITEFVDGQPKSFIQNAAKAKVQGVEVETLIKLGRLDLSEAFTYLDAGYDSFETETAPGVFADLSNNGMAQAPKWTNTLTASLHLPVPAAIASDLTLDGTYAFQSKIYFSDFNQENQGLSNKLDSTNSQGGYGIVNFNLTATDIFKPHFDASLFLKNANNTTYSVGRASALSSFGYASTNYGDPRTFGVTLSYRFE
ncbi:MAG: hypothetical protein JWM78_3694 [Verrucomicrobiaceae bacterium]|nr:hypothetical protein [Verrucomicrobiaceae bacterium]